MKIIVDTNIVFSAILNSTSKIGQIIINSSKHFEFFSCHYLEIEIQKHRNKLLKLTKLSENELAELQSLVTHNITFINERLLPQELLLKTEDLLNNIDINDTPFVALTRYLEGKLWTGDMKLFNGLKALKFPNIITTQELYLVLEDLERD